MNLTKYAVALSIGMALLSSPAWAAQEYTADIRIDLGAEGAPVPPALYGIFMEEINHAFDGGIYAELTQNRSFEEGVLPPGMKLVENEDGSLRMELEKLPAGVPQEQWPMPWPWNGNCGWDLQRALIGWSLRQDENGTAQMRLTEANPMNDASSRSLEIAMSQGKVSLVNSGYWGIDVEQDTDYRLKFHLRPGDFRGSITASLESRDGKVLAGHPFGQVTSRDSWSAYDAVLKASGTDAQARFVLTFEGEGTLQVDWVSLLPPTFKDRPNGLRRDLAQWLADLKPDFVRYPGGCYVEGLSFESAPDWRTMVCPPEERPGQWGYWKYRSTDGFGYHEFLQFCEDIGADAMYVSFAGMTVHPENNWPIDELDPIIQRTLDAIEYAIGPADSKWGNRRAAMGHPDPFPLKYVEIGNEHPPALYGDYYVRFRDAIKARYPDMTVIMSMYWSGLNRGAIARAGDANIDIVDEHAYHDAQWVRANFDYFDRYDRDVAWDVYVGEYASHHAGGNLLCALSDSVFLMMMERNGDKVTMASYAPLFVNVNDRSWGVNLIEFDSARSFAHASYYVQKVFNENRPDVNLETTTDVTPQADPRQPLMAGKFGLGAWNTQTEFKDLRIYDPNGRLICRDDFADLSNWETPGVGQWQVRDGVLRQRELHRSPAMLLLRTPELDVGRVEVRARRVGGQEGFLMFFGAEGIERFFFCNYGAAGNTFSAIQERGTTGDIAFRGGRTTSGPIANERWYDLRLEVDRVSARMYSDGQIVSTARVEPLESFFAQAGYDRQANSVILKATNYYGVPVSAMVRLDHAATVGTSGQHIIIRAQRLTDHNTLEQPHRITPQAQSLQNCAREFSVTLPPYSVNVLRIPARR